MEIHKLKFKTNEGNFERESYLPKFYEESFYRKSPLGDPVIFNYCYFFLKPDRFKDVELEVRKKRSNTRYDVEPFSIGYTFLVSQKFKDVCTQELLPLDFFPVLSDGERWYIMMWRGVPVLGDYEVDVEASRYFDLGDDRLSPIDQTSEKLTLSEDFLRLRGIKNIFSFQNPVMLFITDSVKSVFDKAGLEYEIRYPYSISITNNKISKEAVSLAIINQQKIHLYNFKYEQKKKAYDYLEQVLLAEGDKDVIEKFNTEIKNKWEDQFIRFANGTLPPDERVKNWLPQTSPWIKFN